MFKFRCLYNGSYMLPCPSGSMSSFLYNKFGKLSYQSFMPALMCACMKHVNNDVIMQLVTSIMKIHM